jgi:hypothetical protein
MALEKRFSNYSPKIQFATGASGLLAIHDCFKTRLFYKKI